MCTFVCQCVHCAVLGRARVLVLLRFEFWVRPLIRAEVKGDEEHTSLCWLGARMFGHRHATSRALQLGGAGHATTAWAGAGCRRRWGRCQPRWAILQPCPTARPPPQEVTASPITWTGSGTISGGCYISGSAATCIRCARPIQIPSGRPRQGVSMRAQAPHLGCDNVDDEGPGPDERDDGLLPPSVQCPESVIVPYGRETWIRPRATKFKPLPITKTQKAIRPRSPSRSRQPLLLGRERRGPWSASATLIVTRRMAQLGWDPSLPAEGSALLTGPRLRLDSPGSGFVIFCCCSSLSLLPRTAVSRDRSWAFSLPSLRRSSRGRELDSVLHRFAEFGGVWIWTRRYVGWLDISVFSEFMSAIALLSASFSWSDPKSACAPDVRPQSFCAKMLLTLSARLFWRAKLWGLDTASILGVVFVASSVERFESEKPFWDFWNFVFWPLLALFHSLGLLLKSILPPIMLSRILRKLRCSAWMGSADTLFFARSWDRFSANFQSVSPSCSPVEPKMATITPTAKSPFEVFCPPFEFVELLWLQGSEAWIVMFTIF